MTGKVGRMSNYDGGFSGGLTVRGMPLNMAHPGKVFWVSDTDLAAFQGRKTPSNGNKGTFMDPFATIKYAMTQTVADRGDILMVLPGHTETVANATDVVLDVAGVALIGLGQGSLRPKLNYTAVGSTIDVTADNVTVVNFQFTAGVSAVVLGLDVSADFLTLQSCEFNFSATGFDFITMVDIDTSDDCVVDGNTFIAEVLAGCDEAIRIDTATRVKLINNYATGDFTTGCITGQGAASLNILIADNQLYNLDATAAGCIMLVVACTGLLSDNRCGGIKAAAPEAMIDPGTCRCNENYVCNLIDTTGILIPINLST